MKTSLITLFGLLLFAATAQAGSLQECGKEAKPCVRYGAKVFQARCSLCHGTDGHGEGILPMSIKQYPNTNLLDPKHGTDTKTLTNIIKHGSSLPQISPEMPPWGDELTATQLDSVVMFVKFLRKDVDKALQMLREEAKTQKPSTRIGRAIFKGRCVLCHGDGGEGNGKMARIIKDPPPFNLTKSSAPDEYLKLIIEKGGKALGRSERMPPWGTDLSNTEIDSLIIYIKKLREK